MKRFFAFLAMLLIVPFACAEQSVSFFAMDTIMSIQADRAPEELLTECIQRVEGLEALLSVSDASSEIAALNRTGEADLSDETALILTRALELCSICNGALDVTLYPVIRTWGFTTGSYRVPNEDELSGLVQNVDFTQVSISKNHASIGSGMMVDLGSVVKGYTSQVLHDMLIDAGITSGIINLGGNVHCIGSKPNGNLWNIGIRDPQGDGYCAILSVRDCAVITSGSYERSFQGEDGIVYGHIFDPETGRPVQNDLLSVTVIGKDGMLCDALSTALFVMGSEQAAEYLLSQTSVDAVLVRSDGTFLITKGIADSFRRAGTYENNEILLLQ